MKSESSQLFEETINWLKANYSNYIFFVERDIVWTVQTYLIEEIGHNRLPLRVINDYGILPGERRKLSTDIAIVDNEGVVEIAAEFKYEPSHKRIDIPQEKLPVVIWGKESVAKDIQRIRDFVEKGGVRKAYSIFIDEGGYFKHREPHPGSEWVEWGKGVWVLYSIFPNK